MPSTSFMGQTSHFHLNDMEMVVKIRVELLQYFLKNILHFEKLAAKLAVYYPLGAFIDMISSYQFAEKIHKISISRKIHFNNNMI